LAEQFISQSAEETIRWGRQLGARLKAPVLVLLCGELGSGKTTLAKGIVRGLGAAQEEEVTSPTFTLIHLHGQDTKVYHLDLFRVENLHDFESLGLEDVFAKPAVVLLEWPDRLSLKVAWPRVRIHLQHLGRDHRRIAVDASEEQEITPSTPEMK